MKFLESFLASLIGAWLKYRAEENRKKAKNKEQAERLTKAIDEYKKARTREEKILANKKLSESFSNK